MKVIFILVFLNFIFETNSQIKFKELIFSDADCHARGLTTKNKFIFISTNIGKVYKINPNRSGFREVSIFKGEIKGELRDIELSRGKLICMESGDNGFIYVHNFRINLGEIFLDGISFNKNVGFAMGDQVDGFFSLFYSTNGGESWNPCLGKLSAPLGENGFAASGSTVKCLNDSTFLFVTGGSESNLYKSSNRGVTWKKYPIPFSRNESSGAFSFAYSSENHLVAVGGDYQKPENKSQNCFVSQNGGMDWYVPEIGPFGYRSCIVFSKGKYFTCGTNGLEYSKDGGKTWIMVNTNNYLSMCLTNKNLVVSTNKNKIHIYQLNQFK